MKFCEDYRPYFAAARHNVSPKARAYLAGLLMKGERKNMERMEEYVEDYAYENQQQFLSDSPWDERALMRQVGGDVSEAVGGPDSAFILDESGFGKKGDSSVGVARQWNGRQGKVDNCQVGVFAALSDGNMVRWWISASFCLNRGLRIGEDARRPKSRRIAGSTERSRNWPGR